MLTAIFLKRGRSLLHLRCLYSRMVYSRAYESVLDEADLKFLQLLFDRSEVCKAGVSPVLIGITTDAS